MLPSDKMTARQEAHAAEMRSRALFERTAPSWKKYKPAKQKDEHTDHPTKSFKRVRRDIAPTPRRSTRRPKGEIKEQSLYMRKWREHRARLSFVKHCTCWRLDCNKCMRAFQSRMKQLDHMITKGWGNIPQEEMPVRWTTIIGPDVKERHILKRRSLNVVQNEPSDCHYN